MPISLGIGLGLGMGGGVSSLLAQLLRVPNLVSAYDVADTSSIGQALTFGTVGAIGSPAGFVLDKVQLGDRTAAQFIANQPELITNGTFDSDVSSWTVRTPVSGTATATWVAGKLRFSVTGTNYVYQSFTTVVGEWYRVTGSVTTITNTSSSFFVIRKADTNNASSNAVNFSGNSGVSSPLYFKATATTTFIVFQVNSTGGPDVFDLDDVSVKRVPGYHARSDTTGHRPTVATGPFFDFDGVDDVLNADIGANLGSACSVYHRTQAGANVWLDAQTIAAGNYALSTTDWGRAAIFSAQPSAADKAITEAWGAAYPTPPFPDGFLALDATFVNNVPTSVMIAGSEQVSQITDNGDGTYSMIPPIMPQFYPNRAATVTIEYETAADWTANPPSGIPLHWFSVNPLEVWWELNTSAANVRHLYLKNNGTNYDTAHGKYPGDGAGWANRGRRRNTYVVAEGALPHAVEDNFIARTETVSSALTVNGNPTKLTFFKNGRPGATANPLTNCKVHRVQIRVGSLSDADIEALHLLNTAANPVHGIGDSFLNGYTLMEQMLLNIASAGVGYVPYSQDGVGGSTLAQQLARMQAYVGTGLAKWFNSTLVIMDGGLTDSTPTDCVNAISGMVGLINTYGGHNRWVYMEPPPENWRPGTPERTAFDAKLAAIQAYAGSHYISTITASHAYAVVDTGDPEYAADQTDIADNMWPASLHISDHVHLTDGVTDADNLANSAGYFGQQVMGKFIYDGLKGLGYLP